MSTDRRRGFLRVTEHQAQELERWAYPDYSEEREFGADNALNYRHDWHEPVLEEEEPGPPPLTAADLDAIRESAYEEGQTEGREAGYQDGFAQGQVEGLEQGTAQGLEQGLAQGLEQGQQQIDTQVGHLTQLIEQLATPLKQVDNAVEQELLRLVTGLTRELIQVELKTNPTVILQTLRESIATLPMAGQIVTIQLHPDDLAVVKDAYGEENLAERQWRLQAEPALQRGDLQLQAGDSTVDYQMEHRIRDLLNGFIGRNAQQAAQAEQAEHQASSEQAMASSEPDADPSHIEPDNL
ncbi:flagellar assembly protein FliH [Photobacterium aphoticum]|uniref:flagellar assembly protein FliH n=1 Tax=Photobacterium aphoticum TaxID=754436 RepID=UPI0009E61E74|nr:flagellar assembly protein FliH [Photobacterium aphoticum]PSU46805.1 flagellar assembly protein FliH [Photobacterium aphoticum]GHA47491.1 flagellar assembly protein FliH [Photobacterium aphoticum]